MSYEVHKVNFEVHNVNYKVHNVNYTVHNMNYKVHKRNLTIPDSGGGYKLPAYAVRYQYTDSTLDAGGALSTIARSPTYTTVFSLLTSPFLCQFSILNQHSIHTLQRP